MNYIIADFIIRLKNAVMANRKSVLLPYSTITKAIGKTLVKERFLSTLSEEEVDGKKVLKADIAYDKRIPLFTDAKIISRPSLRIYAKSKDYEKLRGHGLGKTIVSTNKGIMTGEEAVKKGVGGELLFMIW